MKSIKNNYNEDLEKLSSSKENKYKETLEKLNKEQEEIITNLKLNHQKELIIHKDEVEKTRSSLNELNQKITDFSDLTLNKCMEIYKKADDKEKSLYSIIADQEKNNKILSNQLLSLCKAPTNAVEIGLVGEELISNWVTELFNNSEVINQSQLTAKGDLHVKLNNKLLLLEIKNKNAIVKLDIDKFIRDIEENSDEIHGGLFISINSPAIPGKGDFSLEYICNIPVIYLHVPDKQTLRVAIKTLMFINSNADNGLLTMTINTIYSKLTSLSLSVSTVEKCLVDSKYATDNLRKEIKNSINVLNDLFENNPELKFETSKVMLDFTNDEIKVLHNVYSKNKKAKIEDYTKAMGCSIKYLQDRGGATKIKKIVTDNKNINTNIINTNTNTNINTNTINKLSLVDLKLF